MATCSPLQLLQWPLIALISVVLILLSVFYRRLGGLLYGVLGGFGASACLVLTYAFYRLALLSQQTPTTFEDPFPPVSAECFHQSMWYSTLPFAILIFTSIFQFVRRSSERRQRRSR